MLRKHLSIDGLLRTVRQTIDKIPHDKKRGQITIQDCIMSGLAVYGLKKASLLKFIEHLKEPKMTQNVKTLYGIKEIPSDTYLRERLDSVSPETTDPSYDAVFDAIQRGKILESFVYLDDYYLLSADGTGFFSSHNVSCESCCVKNHKDGSQTYYHQAVGGVIVHPNISQVIPFRPEFIVKQDGENKNDCERNASKRFSERIRKKHPKLRLCVIEDSLASNAPHLQLIDSLNMRYIIGAKEGDHKYLFDYVKYADKTVFEINKDGFVHLFSFINGVPLNEANSDYTVNFLAYTQIDPKGKSTTWTWVTNFEITKDNAYKIMRGGRARWRIENNTFNTLKNQGYNFEHNFGHGYVHLANLMATLLFLIFLIDQIQLLTCKHYQAAKKRLGTYADLWAEMQSVIRHFSFDNWEHFIRFLATIPPP